MTSSAADDPRPEFPPFWNSDQIRRLVGEVVGFSSGPSEFAPSGKVPIAYLKDDAGQTYSVWLNRTVLFNEMKAANPQKGDRIEVIYRGPKTDQRGRLAYHAYSVTNHSRGQDSIPWEQYDGDQPAAWETDAGAPF